MIIGTLVGGNNIPAQLRRFTNTVETEIRQEVEALAITLLRKVKQEKLTGQVLHNRTGRLRASIHHRIEQNGNTTTAVVGTNVEYAAFHEYGFHGSVSVSEHLRMMTVAWGKAVKEPKKIKVSSHTRKVDYPERSFLRSALTEMDGEIKSRLAAALKRAASHG